jgi:pimeloyl-ACP methyl ester carboxylesterase
VQDVAAVLDGLGWSTAYLMGHSWGGHLALHAAVGIPGRLAGVLSIDPLGAVGDGGLGAFGAEMLTRVPEAVRERARVLDEKDNAGESAPEEGLERRSLYWGSYFADRSAAPSQDVPTRRTSAGPFAMSQAAGLSRLGFRETLESGR